MEQHPFVSQRAKAELLTKARREMFEKSMVERDAGKISHEAAMSHIAVQNTMIVDELESLSAESPQ